MLFQHFAKGHASGAKSWGNAVSPDLMHWEQLSHAINPYAKVDGSQGLHAIWSGSAVVDVLDGLGKQEGETKTLFAIYSATNEKFFQGGAYSTDKGRSWTKINGGKPVIPFQVGGTNGQRDPRVFYFAPGNFYVTIMMIGGKDRAVRLWKSKDLINWEIICDIPNKAAECIDMYTVAVDGDPNNMMWVIADAGTNYEVGDFDGKSWKGSGAVDENGRALKHKFDYGDSYYAAQVFNQGPDGRVVHIGWLRSKAVGYRPFLEAGMPFTQQMSIPAEIKLRTTDAGIRMYRNPVKEIEGLYCDTKKFKGLSVKKLNSKLAKLDPELIDMTIAFAPAGDLTLNVRGLPIKYNSEKQLFSFTSTARVEGEKAGIATLPPARQRPYRDNGKREIPAPTIDGKVKLRILVDRASLELFVNDGQAAASFVVVPSVNNRSISIQSADDLKVQSLIVNEVKSAWANETK
jgi:fructan beta-fructosidase